MTDLDHLLRDAAPDVLEDMQLWYQDHLELFQEMAVEKKEAMFFYLCYVRPVELQYNCNVKLYKDEVRG